MNGKKRCMEGKYEDVDDRKKGKDLDGKNGRKEKIKKWKRGSKKRINGKVASNEGVKIERREQMKREWK